MTHLRSALLILSHNGQSSTQQWTLGPVLSTDSGHHTLGSVVSWVIARGHQSGPPPSAISGPRLFQSVTPGYITTYPSTKEETTESLLLPHLPSSQDSHSPHPASRCFSHCSSSPATYSRSGGPLCSGVMAFTLLLHNRAICTALQSHRPCSRAFSAFPCSVSLVQIQILSNLTNSVTRHGLLQIRCFCYSPSLDSPSLLRSKAPAFSPRQPTSLPHCP